MDTSTVVVGIGKTGRRSVQRRRYTREDKRRVVAEACVPGVSVAEVGRRHGINANLLFNWCRQHQQGVLEAHTRQVKLLPVQVTEPVAPVAESRELGGARDDGRIEIILGKDMRVLIIGAVATEHIEQVLVLLRRSV